MNILRQINSGPGGIREVLRVALPLVLSTSAYTLQLFIDRMFLMWYKSSAMSASMYSGILSYTIFALFMGTVMYVNTFVAQYDGAGMPKRVGASVWQGIYFAIGAGILMIGLSPFSEEVVAMAGHAKDIQEQEAIFLKILLIGSMPYFLTVAMSCFYTGRAKTWTVMWVDFVSAAVTIILDYILIFGRFGFPEMGIAGAGLATVAGGTATCIIYFVLLGKRNNREGYASMSGWKFDWELMRRLWKFGLPAGFHYMLDLIGFTLFLTFIGRISSQALAATSVAFQINTLAFMPMAGFATAVSTLVGRELGAGQPELAARSTWSATYITLSYMLMLAIGYVTIPDVFMYPLGAEANAAEFNAIRPIVIVLLGFVAFYSIFDTGNLIFSAAIKGAGDTRFVMYVSIVLNWVLLVIPTYLAVKYVAGLNGLYTAWAAATVYVSVLGIIFFVRFLGGKWKSMRVIEAPVPAVPKVPPIPTSEVDEPV